MAINPDFLFSNHILAITKNCIAKFAKKGKVPLVSTIFIRMNWEM